MLFANTGNLARGAVGRRAGVIMCSDWSPEFEMLLSNSVGTSCRQLDTHCALAAQLWVRHLSSQFDGWSSRGQERIVTFFNSQCLGH